LEQLGVEDINLPKSLINRVYNLQEHKIPYRLHLSEETGGGFGEKVFIVGRKIPSSLEPLRRNYEGELKRYEDRWESSSSLCPYEPEEDYRHRDEDKPEMPKELKRRVPVYATIII